MPTGAEFPQHGFGGEFPHQPIGGEFSHLGRIDGLIALAMALSVSKRHESEALPACLAELVA